MFTLTEFNGMYSNYQVWIEAEIEAVWIKVPEYIADITFEMIMPNFKPYFKEDMTSVNIKIDRSEQSDKV